MEHFSERQSVFGHADLLAAALAREPSKFTGFGRRQMDTLRRELDQNYESEIGLGQPSTDMRHKKLSSIYRT